MKYRNFMLPFIINFFMILVIDYNSEVVNKVLIDSNRAINYPFFDNDNIDLFIARREGRERVDYIHPDLKDILKPTYGIIIYQEQIMQIVRKMASYSYGEADILRRAMS